MEISEKYINFINVIYNFYKSDKNTFKILNNKHHSLSVFTFYNQFYKNCNFRPIDMKIYKKH